MDSGTILSTRAPYQHDERARTELRNSISEAIKQRTKCSSNDAKAYVLPADVKRAWNHRSIAIILGLDGVAQGAIIDKIYENMTVLLTILLWISARDCLANFVQRLFVNNEPWLTDKRLPLQGKDVDLLNDVLDRDKISIDAFERIQYRYWPYIIETFSEEIMQLDSRWRLPFEEDFNPSRHIGSGAYGDVYAVPISKGCLRKPNGTPKSDSVVVVKHVFILTNLQKEARNLIAIKKSLSYHNNILRTYAIITHGSSSFIVMPYADKGDLWQFLHDGKDPEDNQKYNFRDYFPEVSFETGDIAYPLICQLRCVTDALKYLHEPARGRFRGCHFDLKPDNILIHQDKRSIVGSWKISDFGLSVIQDPQAMRQSSFRQYLDQRSIQAKTPRGEGSYTAPEVKHAHKEGISVSGTRADTWAMGCIASEVLAFAINGSRGVENFEKQRREGSINRENDHFYSEIRSRDGPALAPYSLKNYVVREQVKNWLLTTSQTFTMQRWAGCWAETIQEILNVNSRERPSADELHRLIEHVEKHILKCRQPDPQECGSAKERLAKWRRQSVDGAYNMEDSMESAVTLGADVRLEELSPPVVDPIDIRSPISGLRINVIDSDSPQQTIVHDTPQEEQPSIKPRSNLSDTQDLSQDQASEVSADNMSHVSTNISSPPLPVPSGWMSASELRPRRGTMQEDLHIGSLTDMGPLFAHGIRINPGSKQYSQPIMYEEKLDLKDISNIAISSYENNALLATLHKKSPRAVHVYKIQSESVAEIGGIELGNTKFDAKSLGIAMSGPFLACWGRPKNPKENKTVYLHDVRSGNAAICDQNVSGSLRNVLVSRKGTFALLFGKRIDLRKINSSTRNEMTLMSQDSNLQDLNVGLHPGIPFDITHAAFNDNGDVLFAWLESHVGNFVFIWTINHDRLEGTLQMPKIYSRQRWADHKYAIYPLNSYVGCLVSHNDQTLFRVAIGLQPFETRQPKASPLRWQLAQIYGNHSLITATNSHESGSMDRLRAKFSKNKKIAGAVIQEYEIDMREGKTLLKSSPLCTFNTTIENGSAICILKQESSDDVLIVLANLEGHIEVATFKATPVTPINRSIEI